MKRVWWWRPGGGAPALQSRLRWLLLLLLLALPPCAHADGPQTGLITGQVVDASGAGVGGVQVSVSGPQIRRTETADDQGRFRFLALGVGTYDVHAELLGLAADARGVQVSVGRTAVVQLRLVGPGQKAAAASETAPPAPQDLAAQESIQVFAEASVIDRFDTRIGANVGFGFIDRLPVQRFYQSVALLLPGVSGGEDGNPNVNGALRSDNQFLIDGVDTTDPVTGLFGLNLAYQAIQEVSVTTAAAPAEYGRSSGGVIDVVTRSGTNDYQGVARLLAANNSWNSPYHYPARQVAPLAPEIAAANAGSNHLDPTVALSLGGPLLRDRLYLFGAYDDSQSTFTGPTHQGTLWDRGSEIESSAAKLTWQVDPENTVVGQFTNDSTDFAAFDPFNRGFAENRTGRAIGALQSTFVDRIPGDIFALERQGQDGNFEKVQWNSALRQDMSAELTLAQQQRDLTRRPLNSRGLTGDAPHLAVIEPGSTPPGQEPPEARDLVLYNGITDQGSERRPRRQGNLVLNGFLQLGPTDHELKGGVDVQRTISERHFNFPGQAGVDRLTGNPVEGQLFTDLDQAPGCAGQACPPFDPATGAFQPFQVFQFWRRGISRTVEQTVAGYLSDSIAVERWLVSIGGRFEAVRASDRDLGRLIDSGTLAPRLAVTFDASGDRRVLLTGTYGWYYDPFLHSYLDTYSNFDSLSGYTPYTWKARDPACAGKDPRNLDSRCWVPGTPVPFVREQPSAPHDDLHRSWLDEATVGFRRQMTASVGVSLYYIHRRWHDLWDNVLHGVFSPNGTLISTTSEVVNLPQARRQQQSLQLLVQKRFSDHWQLLGSYTRSRTEGNLFDDSGAGTSSFADFRDVSDVNLVNRFGLAPYDRRDQLKVFSSYRWAWRALDLSLGTALLYESGLPYQMETLDPLGVRFLTPRGALRLPDVFQLDLSFGAELLLLRPGLSLELRTEVFNLTDQKQVLAVGSLIDNGQFGKPGSIVDLQAPRSFRVTLGLKF